MPVLRRGPRGGWDQARAEFVEAQAGRCAICFQRFDTEAKARKPHVDHDHDTHFVRGVLCNRCNINLGWYERNRRSIEDYLSKAAEFQAYHVIELKGRGRRDTKAHTEWVRNYWDARDRDRNLHADPIEHDEGNRR